MNTDTKKELQRIAQRYHQYNGITVQELERLVKSSPLPEYEAALFIRMILGMEFNETEIFSIEEVMKLTKKSKEEVTEQMNELGISPLHFSSTIPGLFN